MHGRWNLLIGFVLLGPLAGTALAADERTPEQIEFFENRIRPLFVNHCQECHGEERAKGGLRLTTGEAFRRGGDSGPAFMAGKPDESLLIEAVGHRGDIKMPPKQKLAEQEIADLKHWVVLGAPWPAERPDAKSETAKFAITSEQRAFWSFQPVRKSTLPAVNNEAWPATGVDRFILTRLEAAGLKPSPEADRRTLIRRITFDVTGLPPTPAEVDAFVADNHPDAWEQLVDRLLLSPQYGERWARYWLDVARYAEDQAHTFQARMYPNGYLFRDWVVKSLNEDLPYDQFVMQQIAGDLLDGPVEKKHDRETALGYFALGPVYYADAGCAFKASLDELDDRLDTLARGFLGLTLACARCHDHKFDPISQQDYYALAAVFRGTNYREAPLVPAEVVAKYDEGQKQIREFEARINKQRDQQAVTVGEQTAQRASRFLTAVWRLAHPAAGREAPKRSQVAKEEEIPEFLLERWQTFLVLENREKIPALAGWFDLNARAAELVAVADSRDVPSAVVEAALNFELAVQGAFSRKAEIDRRHAAAIAAAPEAEKNKIAKPALDKPDADLLAVLLNEPGLCKIPGDRAEGLLTGEALAQWKALKAEFETVKKGAPPRYLFAHSLAEGSGGNMKLHIRGNPNRTGDEVPRRFLEILSPAAPIPMTTGSGRLNLARAIANPSNPLTARVIVNRLWQQHFGRGLVATSSNFGSLGERPSHPELLDYLASRLIEQGWSLRRIHREILLSATYRQSSADDARGAEVDPDNRQLWRMNRRRLDVEAWRDAVLATSGTLDGAIGGPSGNLASADFVRRTLYGRVSRHNLDGMLRLFDFPDPNITSEKRTVTTVPLQQLFVLNSDFMVRQAKALAARVGKISNDDAVKIAEIYRILYGRAATDEELSWGREFINAPAPSDDQPATQKSALSRWEQYAQVLLSLNEFTFVD